VLRREHDKALSIATEESARLGGHAFYEQVNQILEEQQFDAFVEGNAAVSIRVQ